MVTVVGLLAHLPIVFLLFDGRLVLGGVMIIIFGLFDTLDGALARVQNVASTKGMFLDALSDRLKEVLILTGLSGYFLEINNDLGVILCILTLGISMSVSYAKAKGEAAIVVSKYKISHDELNRFFEDGLGAYEIRIFLIALGCLFGYPSIFLSIILLLASYTLLLRTIKIMKAL